MERTIEGYTVTYKDNPYVYTWEVETKDGVKYGNYLMKSETKDDLETWMDKQEEQVVKTIKHGSTK